MEKVVLTQVSFGHCQGPYCPQGNKDVPLYRIDWPDKTSSSIVYCNPCANLWKEGK
jgi:hypothetical protein